MARMLRPAPGQLDLFAESAPAPPALLDIEPSPTQRLLFRLACTARFQSEVLGEQLGRRMEPDPVRCARLVNLILRRVASDRPAMTDDRLEMAIALLPGWWQDVRCDAGGDRRVWALVRGEVAR